MIVNIQGVLHGTARTSKTAIVVAAMLLSVSLPVLVQGTAAAAPKAAPKDLRLVNSEGTHPCGLHTRINTITPTWDEVRTAISYNYKVNLPNGSVYGPVNVGNATSVTGPFGAEGTSSFTVQAVYQDGSTSDWADPCDVTYDATMPVITSNIGAGAALKGIVSVTETVTEANPSTYSIRVLDPDGNPVSVKGKVLGVEADPAIGNSLTYEWGTTLVADGPYKLQFTASDKAGNSNIVTLDVNVDNTMPGVSIDSYPTPISDSTPTISGGVDDDNANVHVTINGKTYIAAPSAGKWAITTDPLPDNTYAISAVATDAAGNVTSPPASSSITLDTTAPSVAITNPVDGAQVQGVIEISGTVSEATSYTLSINGNVVLTGISGSISYPWGTSNLASGTYIITLSARDDASNVGQDSVTVTIDTTAPAVPVQTAPTDDTIGTSATITSLSWLASPDVSVPVSYNVQIATEPTFTNLISSTSLFETGYNLGGLGNGSYYWRVQACDSLNNCSDWSTGWRFTVDNLAPIVTIDESDTTDTTPVLKGTVNDPSAIVSIKVSGITYGAVVSTIPNANGTYDWAADITETLSIGVHIITVFAKDTLGNNSVRSGAVTVVRATAETSSAISRLTDGSSVLGSSAQTGVVSDVAATDTKAQVDKATAKANNKFLGLGWWWLPLLVLLVGTTYYGYTYRSNRS